MAMRFRVAPIVGWVCVLGACVLLSPVDAAAEEATDEPLSHGILPVGDVEDEFPDAVAPGRRPPSGLYLRHAPQRAERTRPAMAGMETGRRVQHPENVVDA